MTARRYRPESILIHLTWATEPPTSAEIRTDFVRLAMSRFAWTRGYHRLGSLFYSSDVDTLKGLFLALQGSPKGSNDDTCPITYRHALKSVGPAWHDTEFIRLAAIAGDVLDWDMAGEWDRYVRPAWLVLCDEVEYERELALEEADDMDWMYWWKNTGYSTEEAKLLGRADLRRWGR